MTTNHRPLLDAATSCSFHVDSFSVPDAWRGEFEAARRRNMAFIQTLPGFRGHVVLEKTDGPTTFNIMTIAAWESSEALEKAGIEVRAYFERIGFDRAAMLARWEAKVEVGNFQARAAAG